MRRPTLRFCRPIVLAALVAGLPHASAAPPEQFRAWGTAGPELAPAPAGWVEAAPTEAAPVPAPTSAEARRGYVLFARDPFDLLGPAARPAPWERAGDLSAFATPGEYEPLALAIHAVSDLRGLRCHASELRGPGGAAIPADHVDVRVARAVRVSADRAAKTFAWRPFLLERRETFAVGRGATALVWVTVKVPESAAAGDYSGTLTLRPDGGETATVGLRLHVLPFTLPPVPVPMGMYTRAPASDERLRQHLVDLREHGCVPEGLVSAEPASRDRRFGDDDVAAIRASARRAMAALKEVYGAWRFPVTFGVGHQIGYYWDQAKAWFAFWPHSPEVDADFVRAAQVMRDLARVEGWPPLRAYALDEAGAHNLLDEAVYYYRLLKAQVPDVATWTTIGGGISLGHDEIRQLSEVVDTFTTNRFTPEIARALEARGKPFGVYNGSGDTPAGARFFFGFYGWKSGAAEISQWAYHFGDGIFSGGGLRAGDEGCVYEAPDGPLPSLMWEGVREGVDDYRYLELLWQMAGAATRAGGEAAREAEAARHTLSGVLGGISWTWQAVAYEERTPPPHPGTLRKWRQRIAAQILRLGARVPYPGAGGGLAAARRSPFDFAWAAPAPTSVPYGDELLGVTGFEEGMAPWRVEAWNGKGTGALDPAAAHTGKQSVRVDVAPESANTAVTVLVWPKWGGGGLSLALEADRVYEFSAWVKLQGRSVPPSLRINLPAGAGRGTRSGSDGETPEGWRRLWTRVEMNARAEPGYVAVWVQGPGTVWLDDLSLREVIPQPLAITLDQAAYDAADHLGEAAVTGSRRLQPARARITIASGARRAARVEAPFRDGFVAPEEGAARLTVSASGRRLRVLFDPSALAPGAYQVKAELLDGSGVVLGTAEAGFRRESDENGWRQR